MLDVKFIVDNRQAVKESVVNKNEKADIDRICELYEQKKSRLFAVEQLRKELNERSEAVAKLKREGKDATALIGENRGIGAKIKEIEQSVRETDDALGELLAWVPNVPAAIVPVGKDSACNVVVKSWGERKTFAFAPLPHWEIGARLDIIDVERSGKIAGANFILLKGAGALLERALINFMLDLHTTKHGYTEVCPPYLATRESMFGTGQIPKLEDDMYRTKDDEGFLIPTGEVPLTNLHRGEILNGEQLPLRYTAYTACFRREAGAYGKDTRGLLRVHQFDKVELVKFAHPDSSMNELNTLLENAEEVIRLLGLEYRVIRLCTGDMSFASAITYDIEVWAPGVGKWLEVSSCSNFGDFQARRSNIRFRDAERKTRFVHTLNGSGVALPRTVIAILENYQQSDGAVVVPEVLVPYMNGRKMIGGRSS